MKYLIFKDGVEKEVTRDELYDAVESNYEKSMSAFYYMNGEKYFRESAIQSPGIPIGFFKLQLSRIAGEFREGEVVLFTFDRAVEMAEHLRDCLETQIEYEASY